MIGGSRTAKCSHSLPIEAPFVFLQFVIVLVIQKTGEKGKCPVAEYFNQPVVGFGIFLLEAHHYCLWLIFYGHDKCNHLRAVCTPAGFDVFLAEINLIEREEVVPILIAVSTKLLIILDRIVDGWFGIGCRGDITCPCAFSNSFFIICIIFSLFCLGRNEYVE